jgi:hypothetical protein
VLQLPNDTEHPTTSQHSLPGHRDSFSNLPHSSTFVDTQFYAPSMTDGSGNQLQHATSASDSTVPIPEPSFSDAPAPEPSSSLFLSTNAIYFGAHYLATILAVLLSLLWRIIDTDLRRLEPFYQLSQPTGTSLTENLLFTSIFVLPIHAVRRRQWSVLLSTMIYCPLLTLVQILAVFGNPGSVRPLCTYTHLW